MIISSIPKGKLTYLWHLIAPVLQPAIDWNHGRTGPDDVLQEILIGNLHCWIAMDAEPFKIHGVVITRITQYPQRKMLSAPYCAGADIVEWKVEMVKVLDKFAVENGCDGFECTGRPGWGRFLGMKEVYRTYEKDY